MRNTIAHSTHIAPRNIGILRDKFGITNHHLCSGLADDNETHDNSALGSLVGQKTFLVEAVYKAA